MNKITFNNNVKPVCLPSYDAPIFEVNGYVVGYGKSEENSHHETKPKYIQITSVTQESCLFYDQIFVQLSSPRMFCAGELNKNPCKGDSGGGFYVKNGNSFQINGVVSTGIHTECSINQYVLFTNVVKFLTWIGNKMHESQCRETVKCRLEDYEG